MLRLLFTGRRLWLTLFVILAALVCCRLGFWQIDRLQQRQARNALINARMAQPEVSLEQVPNSPDDYEYLPVVVRGVYDTEQEVLQRLRELDGVPGMNVITPLRVSGTDRVVLVDRGWLPLSLTDRESRKEYAETGEVEVHGIVRRSQAGIGGPKDPPLREGETRRDAWFRVDVEAIEQQVGYPLEPFYIVQQPRPDDPFLPARTATTDTGSGPHLNYIIQWFGFAVILLVGYPILLMRSQRAKLQPKPVRAG